MTALDPKVVRFAKALAAEHGVVADEIAPASSDELELARQELVIARADDLTITVRGAASAGEGALVIAVHPLQVPELVVGAKRLLYKKKGTAPPDDARPRIAVVALPAPLAARLLALQGRAQGLASRIPPLKGEARAAALKRILDVVAEFEQVLSAHADTLSEAERVTWRARIAAHEQTHRILTHLGKLMSKPLQEPVPKPGEGTEVPADLVERFNGAARLAREGKPADALQSYRSLLALAEGAPAVFIGTARLRAAFCLMDLGRYEEANRELQATEPFASSFDNKARYEYRFAFGNTLGNLGALDRMMEEMIRAISAAEDDDDFGERPASCWRWILHHAERHQAWAFLAAKAEIALETARLRGWPVIEELAGAALLRARRSAST